MALSEMSIIKKAEEESAENLALANAQKAEIETRANREVSRHSEGMRANIAKYQAELNEKYDRRFTEFEKEFNESLEKEAAALKGEAGKKKKQVVAFILEEVMKYGH